MKKTTLLIIEDEVDIRDMIRFSSPSQEFDWWEADSVSEAIRLLSNHRPDLILLDWMLPGQSGINFIQWIKKRVSLKNIPIIMLTAKAEEDNKVKGLTIGADDYVVKPFSPKELLARIRAVLRRGRPAGPKNKIEYRDLVLHQDRHEVLINDHLLALTPIEYQMFAFFMKHSNKIYTRNQLILSIWGTNADIDDRTVDVHIRRLRNKLKPYHYHVLIKTVRGIGYQCYRDD